MLLCRMSDAVEGAEVMLYGVSKRYKESANCRLEANYACMGVSCAQVGVVGARHHPDL